MSAANKRFPIKVVFDVIVLDDLGEPDAAAAHAEKVREGFTIALTDFLATGGYLTLDKTGPLLRVVPDDDFDSTPPRGPEA